MYAGLLEKVIATSEEMVGKGVSVISVWTGDPTPAAFEQLSAGITPAVFISVSDSVSDDRFSVQESYSGKPHQMSAATTVVALCLVADGRSPNEMIYKNQNGALSVLGVCDLVISTLNGLRFDGATKRKPLLFKRLAPFYLDPAGAFVVFAVYFEAIMVLAQRAITPSEMGNPTEFTGIDIDINRVGDVDVDPDQVPQPDPLNPLQNPRNELQLDYDI